MAGRRYHRLHLICGESLCSETALWLKFGVTALIVGMIEGGLAPGRDVRLADPLEAFRVFAGDPTCRAAVPTNDGRRVSALDIQRVYLEHAEANLGAAFLPDWAEGVCTAWREMLDRLEGAPATVAATLDWAIKYAIYTAHLHRRGTSWEAMLCWSMVIQEIIRCARLGGLAERPVTLERLIGPRGPMRLTAAGLTPLLREHGEGWDRLPHFQRVRRELFEIDTRFGQIGSPGLFARMDRAGLLSHKVEGVEPIDPAALASPRRGARPPARRVDPPSRERPQARSVRLGIGHGLRTPSCSRPRRPVCERGDVGRCSRVRAQHARALRPRIRGGYPPHPHPFRIQTVNGYTLPAASSVRPGVFASDGKIVEALIDQHVGAGAHESCWKPDGKSAGMCFVRLSLGGEAMARRGTIRR